MSYRLIATALVLAVLVIVAIVFKPLVLTDSGNTETPKQNTSNSDFKM